MRVRHNNTLVFRIFICLAGVLISLSTVEAQLTSPNEASSRDVSVAAAWVPFSIPMRDGKALAGDLYATDTTVAKPVILIQTPYNKNNYRLSFPRSAGPAFPSDTAKYHYVVVDWRGFYGSKDADVKGYDRGLDGYDVVEWIAAQPWSNGRVGTWGPSALGQIQFMTARRHPPHLLCSVPLVKDYQSKYSDYYYGGDFRKEHVETLEKLGFLTVQSILSQPVYNNLWKVVENTNDYPEDIAIPMLLISGWFDHYPDDVLRAFADLRARSGASVRDRHKLIMGPWLHSGVGAAEQGELSYPNATDEAREATLQFFGYMLCQEKNGYPLRPDVRYYQMGSNEWRSTSDWKSVATATRTFYLHDGDLLSPELPLSGAARKSFFSDPRDPSPSHGGARFNPFDATAVPGPLDLRSAVESRSDVLRFSTPPLTENLEIAGLVTVALTLSSDRTDTDLSVRLCDVYPDGRSMIMADGIARARFRNGLDRQEFLIPGQAARVTVTLQNIALTLLKDHRLRIVVGGANFPRFDVNLNNGGAMYTAGDTLIAGNTIQLNSAFPSSITLAVPATSAADAGAPAPGPASIGQNYPNPIRGATEIPVTGGSTAGSVSVRVHDMLGRMVTTLFDGSAGQLPPTLRFDASGLAPGAYVCRLESAGSIVTRVLTVLP
ncbi:MAG: CocE/NonD family hydrolase [Ignavibacteria bacterium]|nr:CocE/NonD family hydrolase [Ignavibacteria bacterium]